MNKTFIFLVLLFVPFITLPQTKVKDNYYIIFFKDKPDTNYSIHHPEKFLSPRAIERREKFNIPITKQDLPVSPTYIQTLRDSGYKIIHISKWFNAVLIHETDTIKLKKIKEFSFIDSLGLARLRTPKDSTTHITKYKVKIDTSIFQLKYVPRYSYGFAETQNYLINIPPLHSLGYDGKGIIIALLDAGFLNLDSIKAFRHLWDNNFILDYYDFVDNDTNVFDVGGHGTMALSTIASFSKKIIGTAPNSSFLLYRTEDENSEYPIEEFNWLVAAERADSIGTDIISSSLGYETFDDSLMNYSYEKMNGNYAISTIAADIAAKKGIIVVLSAGNSGDEPWHYINAPADGDSIIAVGACKYNGKPSYFTSYGPSYDGRIKPDVAALGSFVFVINGYGEITFTYGTSFSAPTIAGAIACLRQAHPDKSNMEIIRAVQMSGNNADNPDNRLGYGIPDMYLAHLILENYNLQNLDTTEIIIIKNKNNQSIDIQ